MASGGRSGRVSGLTKPGAHPSRQTGLQQLPKQVLGDEAQAPLEMPQPEHLAVQQLLRQLQLLLQHWPIQPTLPVDQDHKDEQTHEWTEALSQDMPVITRRRYQSSHVVSIQEARAVVQLGPTLQLSQRVLSLVDAILDVLDLPSDVSIGCEAEPRAIGLD